MGSWMSEMEHDRVKRAGQNFGSFCSFTCYGAFLMKPSFIFPLMNVENGSHVSAISPQMSE